MGKIKKSLDLLADFSGAAFSGADFPDAVCLSLHTFAEWRDYDLYYGCGEGY